MDGDKAAISAKSVIFLASNSSEPMAWTAIGRSWILVALLEAVTIISSTVESVSSALRVLICEKPRPMDNAPKYDIAYLLSLKMSLSNKVNGSAFFSNRGLSKILFMLSP